MVTTTSLTLPNLPRWGIKSYNSVNLSFHDRNKDDKYSYGIEHTSFYDPWYDQYKHIARGSVSHKSGRKYGRVYLNKPRGDYVFVLIGFDIERARRNVDNHVKRIAVYERRGYLYVHFNDKSFSSSKDDFSFEVRYAWVPGNLFTVKNGNRSWIKRKPSDSSSAILPLSWGRMPVINGFDFSYLYGDHHIKSIGVETTPRYRNGSRQRDGYLHFWFHDKNGDDDYRWKVNYAVLR